MIKKDLRSSEYLPIFASHLKESTGPGKFG